MGRWERLADTLADVTPVEVDQYAERCQITIRSGQKLVIIHDTWWRKNLDVWTGWEVYVEGPNALTERTYPRTKKRGEVRQHVVDALAVAQHER